MSVFATIMRIFSYIFHGFLSILLLALSVVTLISGLHNLKLDMLPWKEAQLTYALLIMGILGISIVVLAVKGILRILFFIWTLAVILFMIKGYIFGAYFFADSYDFYKTLSLIVGAILASFGAWYAYKQKPATR